MQKLNVLCALGLGCASALALPACDDVTDDVPAARVEDGPGNTADLANESETTATSAPSPRPAEALAIDTANSTFGFVGSKPTGSQDGSFGDWSGTFELREPVEQSHIVIEIQMASVQTDDDRLSGHLRSDDFFDTEQFPTARFESASFAPAGAEADEATHEVTGQLTLRGQSQTITFPVRIDVDASEVRARAEFSIDRQRWGITYPGMADDLIYDNVVVRFDVHAPRS